MPNTRERFMDAHRFLHPVSNDEYVLHHLPSETIPPLAMRAALQRSGLVSSLLLLEELGNRRRDLRAPISIRWTCSRWNASTLQRERAASMKGAMGISRKCFVCTFLKFQSVCPGQDTRFSVQRIEYRKVVPFPSHSVVRIEEKAPADLIKKKDDTESFQLVVAQGPSFGDIPTM